jgi:CDP-glucose 4,6-dehydratase
MRILVTGHTGFKGSWLSLLLNELGHEVSGLSLSAEIDSHFELSNISGVIRADVRGDIRDFNTVKNALIETKPEFVFHLAAQPYVKEGYRNPIYTYETNVNGTLNLLKASQGVSNLKGMLVITTDKVYSNNANNRRAFKEDDPLGFSDPYSTSKAMADLLTQSWALTAEIPIGVARAGNVIGGGDFGADRLIPDLIRDAKATKKTEIRYPKAVRPWQYVLDCLSGYVLQMENLLKGTPSILNFGPSEGEFFEVEQVVMGITKRIQECDWKIDSHAHPYESSFLTLDSNKAGSLLNWRNKMDFEMSLEKTSEWYRSYLIGDNLGSVSRKQVKDYLQL